jgi:hypothetical protein
MSATTAPTLAPGQDEGTNTIENSATSPGDAAPIPVDAAGETVRAEDVTTDAVQAAAVRRQAREEAAARLRQRSELPPALRERLAAVVTSSLDSYADGQSLVPLEQCLQAIEASLPEFLRQNRAEAARPEHPLGEAFFTGKPEEISDARAEAIAREQLARSGLLRGQRVRVAD